MDIKKKVIVGIAVSFFAIATMFNMSMLNENGAGDVLLDAIEVMAQAEAESGLGYKCKFYPPAGRCAYTNMAYSYCPDYACRL